MNAPSCSSPPALIVGSIRSTNNGDGLASWLMVRFNCVADSVTKLVLASNLMEDIPLPTGTVIDPAWSRVVTATPAFVILTPQYNWGYPGQLKNLLDHLYKEWKNKPVVLVTYGGHGGSKCVEQLQVVLSGGFHMSVVAHIGINLPKEFIRSSERVDVAAVPSFLAEYQTQVDNAFTLLLKGLQH
ncbi:NADPH-dependent FMN reductase [Phytophthora infestans]|uniref:NADPH-dependent FMN reductase n=1 Tax=Phytophthora infestans TaxID=4787 RepID=A0A833TMJ4_PHYIN|nr:NADPH-dependent FMN reductase [Phytophthora infestans]